MKTTQTVSTQRLQPIVSMIGVAMVLLLPSLANATSLVWAAFLLAGAGYVTAQVSLSPQQWRSRTGSLVLAKGLVAFMWLAALVGIAVAIRHGR